MLVGEVNKLFIEQVIVFCCVKFQCLIMLIHFFVVVILLHNLSLFLVFCRAVAQEDAFSRMKQIVRWYLSGFYKKPKVNKSAVTLV